MLGTLRQLFSALYGNSGEIATIYYGAESGAMVIYNSGSAAPDAFLYFAFKERPWYIAAKEAGNLIWTDVYSDFADRGLTVTCALPVYAPDGRFMGVVGMDILLYDMNETVVKGKVGESGYAFLTDQDDQLVASIHYGEDGRLEGDQAFLQTLDRDGVIELNYNDSDFFLARAPLPLTSWNLGVVLPVEEVMAPAVRTDERIAGLTADARDNIRHTILTIVVIFFVLLCAMLAVVYYLSKLFSRKLTAPIFKLIGAVTIIGGGDLDHEFKIETGDEIQELGDAFSAMTKDLKRYIQNLTEVLSAQERLAAELEVATHIQASMLPRMFEPFPGRGEIDLYATMEPAKEVGGDFYDFFPVGEDSLCFVIADVSGKGVPAALFMVVARTMLKNQAQFVSDPARILIDVNNALCEGNDEAMFVTALLGIIDLSTGHVRYANAGHNPPVIIRDGGQADWLDVQPGFMLAGMPGMDFSLQETTLQPGDTLLLYTDGVTEAHNPAQDLYSDPRLLINCAKAPSSGELSDFLGFIRRDIDEFSDGAEQADDITMLALRYNGNTGGATAS
jgi:sigma-B regulation protein RsbU (phosphoserine phosphatase)